MTERYNDPVIELLAEENITISQEIARNDEDLDYESADLILRNAAVITDRLNFQQLKGLSEQTQEQLMVLAFIASDLAPLSAEDLELEPEEDPHDHMYRTTIWQQIHAFQTKVHTKNYDSENNLEMSKIRYGVEAAGLAFASTLKETSHIPVIAKTVGYFQRNTSGAQVRTARTSA